MQVLFQPSPQTCSEATDLTRLSGSLKVVVLSSKVVEPKLKIGLPWRQMGRPLRGKLIRYFCLLKAFPNTDQSLLPA